METTPDAPAISPVDIRLPPFWTAYPQLWFLQVESQFTARRITAELTKYHHVVASLPPAIASEIRNLQVAPPAENAYTMLKQLLISCLMPSEPQRLQQLLHDTELGDRTPSQLLRHMRQLLHTAGATTTDADSGLLRELFLQRLPVNVRMILASAADKRLSQLAELADSVLAVAPPSVAALQPDIAGCAPTSSVGSSCHSKQPGLGSTRGVNLVPLGGVRVTALARGIGRPPASGISKDLAGLIEWVTNVSLALSCSASCQSKIPLGYSS
ncbi:hypothetical protein HPB50_018849 [Hyalomma asiaticum]|uniref:Uncharacterized protein n=1 Tax=Hyalomma asiaticum TaxID=266040 RepID=A0ACB7SIR1_HYAAI|nr:hypothetical protein HPB50_018849 [Hyalomma asiaticum]